MIASGCVLIAPAASARVSAPSWPAFYTQSDASGLGGSVDINFIAEELDTAGDTERLVLSVPAGYGADLARAAGQGVGTGQLVTVPAAGGAQTTFKGKIVEISSTAYGGDAGAQACAPGTHAAYWALQGRSASAGSVQVPIAVDRSGGGYELTMCFDTEHGRNLQISAIELFALGVFRTPTTPAKYLFDATVTPFAADGTPSTGTAYEMRAYEVLPESLTATATFHRSTHTLNVTGTMRVQGKPRRGATVDVLGAQNANSFGKQVGSSTTRANGTYSLARRVAQPPPFVWTQVQATAYQACNGTSPAPGGCASYSIDGAESPSVSVTIAP